MPSHHCRRFGRLAGPCLAALLVFLAAGCATAPISNRGQVMLVSDAASQAASVQQYQEVLAGSKLSGDAAATASVHRVGGRIAAAVDAYCAQNQLGLKFEWEFNLIQDDQTANAWCMPGGKVAVYTGILPYTQDETGLAVVLGHEIAHAVARHGQERQSQVLLAQLGVLALDQALAKQPPEKRQLYVGVAGLGAQYGILLPYSRSHELEADHLGLVFMALAGYDPHAAVPFWQRMAKAGAQPPVFLSTHPSNEQRIRAIQQFLPSAMASYRPQP